MNITMVTSYNSDPHVDGWNIKAILNNFKVSFACQCVKGWCPLGTHTMALPGHEQICYHKS